MLLTILGIYYSSGMHAYHSLMEKMFEGMRVVEFIVLLVEHTTS